MAHRPGTCRRLAASAAVMVVIAAAAATSEARLYRWGTHNVTYCDASGYGSAVRQGVDWWNSTPGNVRLRRAGCAGARIVVRSYYRRTRSVAGFASYPPDGRVRLNRYWMERLDKIDRADIAAHEIGHALGLVHMGGCSLMNPSGGFHGKACNRPGGLYPCGPQRRDARALIRRYGGRLGGFDGFSCGERDRPDPPDDDSPTDLPLAPLTHHVYVHLGPGDDEQRVYTNDALIGSAGYGLSRSFDLGNLTSGSTVRLDLFNAAAGYVWNMRVVVDGVETFRAQAGTVGSIGACSNAQSPSNTVVFRAILDFEGDVVGGFRPC